MSERFKTVAGEDAVMRKGAAVLWKLIAVVDANGVGWRLEVEGCSFTPFAKAKGLHPSGVVFDTKEQAKEWAEKFTNTMEIDIWED